MLPSTNVSRNRPNVTLSKQIETGTGPTAAHVPTTENFLNILSISSESQVQARRAKANTVQNPTFESWNGVRVSMRRYA